MMKIEFIRLGFVGKQKRQNRSSAALPHKPWQALGRTPALP